MAKKSSVFVCQSCGYQSAKWSGKCSSCGEWNSIVEEPASEKSRQASAGAASLRVIAKPITQLDNPESFRILTPDTELNRVLGGGIVPGSVLLLGGEPGIGKSTLLLQMAVRMNARILYVSGEESEAQIKMRADRIGIRNEQCYVVSETELEQIRSHIEATSPVLIVIDSVQTLHNRNIESAPGSVSQIRECANELISLAKSNNIPLMLVGHITKEGYIAGPKVLEHMVDTVLQFEGDRQHNYRLLRANKNRFGSTSEIGIYEMTDAGMREVTNPSEILITHKEEKLSGIAIGASLEGLRPLMVETQALVSSAVYGTPQRNANGFDLRRLNMLLAVLEKRCGFRLGQFDVFINIAGGIKLEDPALDLAIISSILSSYEDIAIPYDYAFAAEVGLSGELRHVSRMEQRIAEAEKLGFSRIYVAGTVPNKGKRSIEVISCSKVEQLFEQLFG